MIFTERTITVHKGVSSMDEPIILYRGDHEVEVRFVIINNKFKFLSGVNVIESEKASYGQLAILKPDGSNVFSDIAECSDGTVVVKLTKEMMDELSEVGLHSFHIRLFDDNQESRVTIPPVQYGIEIREPIASEDHTNVIDESIAGYAIINGVEDEPAGDTFDDNGDYNKTRWSAGHRITEDKLNKIEDALHQINQNEINDAKALATQITTTYNVIQSEMREAINEAESNMLTNMETDIEAVSNAINDGLNTVNNEVNAINEQLEHNDNIGHKVMVLFNGTPTASKTINLLPNGQTLNRICTYNAGWLLGCAVTFAYKLTGTITFNIYRNSGTELLASLECTNSYGGVLKINPGEKKIYEGDLLTVTAVSGAITSAPGEVSFSLVFTQ